MLVGQLSWACLIFTVATAPSSVSYLRRPPLIWLPVRYVYSWPFRGTRRVDHEGCATVQEIHTLDQVRARVEECLPQPVDALALEAEELEQYVAGLQVS